EKARALLAYLAIESRPVHPRERLADLLWPELSSDASSANLRKTLFRLQRALDSFSPGLSTTVLAVRRHEVACHPDAVESDVRELEGLIATWRAHAHHCHATCDDCLMTLETAARCYAGELLEGIRVGDS